MIYLVQGDTLVPVFRWFTSKFGNPADTLAMLAAGPTPAEKERGITTQVPRAAEALTLQISTVTLSVDPFTLSPKAIDQIVCTTPAPPPITLTGNGQTLTPQTCPI